MTPSRRRRPEHPIGAELRRASHDYSLALAAARTARRALRKAELRVKEARRRVKLALEAVEPLPTSVERLPAAALCTGGTGHEHQLLSDASCLECQATWAFIRDRLPLEGGPR